MARNYDLDPQAAKDSNSGGKRIKDAGTYRGKFKSAWYEKNDKGTESVQFLFTSSDGQEAGPLALYTHNYKGEELPSYRTFNAVLACLKQRGIKAERGKVELYDHDIGGVISKEKEIYPALIDTPIGLVLQAEEYQNREGAIKERLLLVAPFDPVSGLMADEILTQAKEPKALQRVSEWVMKNPIKRLKATAQKKAEDSAASFDDSEIPFD